MKIYTKTKQYFNLIRLQQKLEFLTSLIVQRECKYFWFAMKLRLNSIWNDFYFKDYLLKVFFNN